jgi:chromosome segregation protein
MLLPLPWLLACRQLTGRPNVAILRLHVPFRSPDDAMRLKHLELQGYKTFASRTEFTFDAGITAIVGPNGSGKSNVADAIRWVLGEQAYRVLRAKRTEDMIFAGSALRPRVGMASASLVLDNADGWLPVDYNEVAITRRAYRSGENEYLLNGSRVRLRDITELLATSGLAQRTYTVIGQGLVDAVLSQRPEDRRSLFEEASGITLYQSKRAEAVSRLDETRANLVRVNDIVNEIAPRLQRLEREAERAQRHSLLARQLEGLLRTWYGYRWHQEQVTLHRTRDALSRRELTLSRRRQALDELDKKVARLRARQGHLREELSQWHRESAGLHRSMEEVQRDLAVWQERARLLARRGDELLAERTDLAGRLLAAAEAVSAAEKDLADCHAAWQEREGLVAEAQAGLDAHEKVRHDLSMQLARAQARSLDLQAQVTDRRNRLVQLEEQRGNLEKERADQQAAIAANDARAGELAAARRELQERQATLEAETERLAAEAASFDASLAAAQARRTGLEAELTGARQEADRLRSRYDLLGRLRAEGEGLHAGVRAVLQATEMGGSTRRESRATGTEARLKGILGTVAQHIHVPPEYEVAIEVALGGHLQDLVVESWPDAEAAIAYLRQGQRGRATFLPLDTVRPGSRLDLPDAAGVIGVASELVRAEARLAPVVEMLLGRTAVVDNLKAARRAFDRLQGGFQIVTLAGEVLRSSGTVTGGEGKGQAQGQVLAREREWRELPARIGEAAARTAEIQRGLDEVGERERQARESRAALEARRLENEQSAAALQRQMADLEGETALLRRQSAWRQEQIAQVDAAAARLAQREGALQAELEALTADSEAGEARTAALRRDLEALQGEALYRQLSEARTAAAVSRGVWEHRQAALAGVRDRQQQLRSEQAAKEQRIAALQEEQAQLAGQIQERTSRETVIQGWLSALSVKIEPAEAEVAGLEAEREELEGQETLLRARLRQAERSHADASVAHSRQEDHLERLRRQILDDLGLVEMEPTEGLAEQRLLPLGQMVSALPAVEVPPEGLEDEIHQIKAQIRRMGAVNPSAPEEYAEVRGRYTFLSTQAADLEEAARSLREVIAELDEVMRREFAATFKEIAARFRENFTQLFGGGTARLLLTEPEDISQTGIEIVARPPGKRQQALSLLSGGERSLTAVALIFAVLAVSPPPFCVLDEVDAMLDEANVRRFRQALEALSQQTQFILITHNRGTIDAANTIYGVSMGDDSASQLISLRLEGERIAAADGSTVELKAG